MKSSMYVKLVVYVPETHANELRKAIGDAGAGRLGNYGHCSFSIKGVGRFQPLSGANPAIGEIGALEAVQEERIETVVHQKDVSKVIEAMKRVHPYEEVAFDLIPLLTE